MTQRTRPYRAISSEEIAVIERALSVAPTADFHPELLATLAQLRVVDVCGCGCASVEFTRLPQGELPHIVADACAETADGDSLGVIVWAFDGSVSGLEIYSFSDRPAPLPVLSSIVSYGP
ncbi:hypothetical protein [Lysobacter panacisoli]|uniref:Integron gene cassette protein n=1 Tax=Lysobacter panacisoli TaxID=1255263 RepID=A0ABP9LUC1_9GAMM|nr:hypothetical protein [Lysobacter panacisoli]